MNERILELAKQSGILQYESDGKLPEIEKFSKLILKEVLAELDHFNIAYDTEYDQGVHDGFWFARNFIGATFQIEE